LFLLWRRSLPPAPIEISLQATFEDLINFAGVSKDALTADNFSGFDPKASVASVAKVAAAAVAEDIAQEAQPVGDIAAAPTVALFDVGGPEPVAQRD
jgi:hypothetical protein